MKNYSTSAQSLVNTVESEEVYKVLNTAPAIERFLIGNISSYFKGSPIAVLRCSEYDEGIIVKIAEVPWFLREIGAELCFDVIRVFDYKRKKDVLKAINVRPTVSVDYLAY